LSNITPTLLGSLLSTHGSALRLYARQFLLGAESDALADDVVQEALLQLARQRAVPDDPPAWLFRAVRNAALTVRRGAVRRRKHETSAATERSAWFESRAESRLDAQTATAALAELPEETREIVVAHLWGGLTFEQIAALVGMSSSTAHRRYEEGLKTLRLRWERKNVGT
jgi:RNA polymerase sigma-70 factor (ECF subfamily)